MESERDIRALMKRGVGRASMRERVKRRWCLQ
jgi:hypothetical protein